MACCGDGVCCAVVCGCGVCCVEVGVVWCVVMLWCLCVLCGGACDVCGDVLAWCVVCVR